MKHALARAWRMLSHAPDRALHRWRREHAVRRVRGRVPTSVLFVCHGNICRSPFAASLFSQLAAATLPVPVATSSGGFIRPGRHAPPQALAAAARRGVDLAEHRSHLLTPRTIRGAGLVVVMSAIQARAMRRSGGGRVEVIVLGDLDPEPIFSRTIVDPWAEDDTVYEESYDRIDRCVRELVRLMNLPPL